MNGARKGQTMIGVASCVFCVLLLFVMVYSCGQELAVTEYENNVNRIREIDASHRQEELNALVDEGKMNVNYSSKATFSGAVSDSFNVKNIKNNHHPIVFELLDEKGLCLYTSPKIEPGYEINQIELTEVLPKGKHDCKLKVGYVEEGNVFSAFPITIEVK